MPEQRRDIVEALRQADAELQRERLSPAAEQRLQRLVHGAEERRRPWRWVWLPTAAAVAAALLVWILLPRKTPSPRRVRPAQVAGFSVVQGQARQRGSTALACVSEGCKVTAPRARVRLELARGTVVGRRQGQLELVRGRATCRVDKRRAGEPPLSIRVSHGRIEVLGTVFSLRQGPGGGEVQLREGAIRFVSDDGRTVQLAPGQRLRWPLPRPEPTSLPGPATEPGQDAGPAPRRLTPRETESLRHRVARLRNQGRYHEAARVLRHALPRLVDRVTRESFSYELGVILTDHLTSKQACRHWRRHLRRFGARRYGPEIAQARARLGCP